MKDYIFDNLENELKELSEIDEAVMKINEIALGAIDMQSKKGESDSIYDQVYLLVKEFNLLKGRKFIETLIQKCQIDLARYDASQKKGVKEAMEALSEYTIV